MEDRLDIASRMLMVLARSIGETSDVEVSVCLDYADELLKQHALRIAEREKREHEK